MPQRRVERLLDQRALARAADSGHHAENTQRERDVDRFQVVAAGTGQLDGPLGHRPARRRDGDPLSPAQVVAGRRAFGRRETGERAAVEDLTARLAGSGAEVDHVIRRPDHVVVVLDDHQRVPLVAKPVQDRDQPADFLRDGGRPWARRARRAC